MDFQIHFIIHYTNGLDCDRNCIQMSTYNNKKQKIIIQRIFYLTFIDILKYVCMYVHICAMFAYMKTMGTCVAKKYKIKFVPSVVMIYNFECNLFVKQILI